MATRRAWYERLRSAFQAAGIDSASLDARLLLCHGGGFSFEEYLLNPETEISGADEERLEAVERRRVLREPVSRIIGLRGFWQHDFLLNDATLDPRPDTETLVQAVLDLSADETRESFRVLDLGTGTGCILLSLLSEIDEAYGVGVDISFDAVTLARENAFRVGVDERVSLFVGSWAKAINWQKSFDFVVSNPPYICSGDIGRLEPEVTQFDPVRALDGGASGLLAYEDIVEQISGLLKPRGWVLFEVGDGQAEQVEELLVDRGFDVKLGHCKANLKDLAGRQRVVAGRQLY